MYVQALIFMEWSLKPLRIVVHPFSNSYSVNFRMAILMRNITLLKEHFYHNSKTYCYSPICSIIIFAFSNVSLSVSSSVVSDSLQLHRQQLVRLLCPPDSPGKSTGVGCHALFQGIFPTPGSNPAVLHCRWILYHLSHQGSPLYIKWGVGVFGFPAVFGW